MIRDPHEETAVLAGVCLIGFIAVVGYWFWTNSHYILPALMVGWLMMFALYVTAGVVQWRLVHKLSSKRSHSA